MSGRSYLSIGEVLSLLRKEFPDVTISKIRFLESQGLVNPERTPSGYRKFYDHDIERLGWVLRQQREHFLPLKIIKNRLEGEASEGPGAPGQKEAAASLADEGCAGSEVGVEWSPLDLPALVGQASAPVAAMARPAGAAVAGTGNGVALDVEGGGGVADGKPAAGATGPAPLDSSPDDVGDQPLPAASAGAAPASSANARAGRPLPGHRPAIFRGTDDVVEAGGDPGSGHGDVAGATGGLLSQGSPTSLSIEELASASGLSPQTVSELQDFGLLSPAVVAGGIAYYDEDALAVAKAAAGFAAFGIEPRHLRLYKNAVDREVGFIEQVVTPLVRQRNPEARLKAVETVDEMARLGLGLRSALLRAAFRSQIGS